MAFEEEKLIFMNFISQKNLKFSEKRLKILEIFSQKIEQIQESLAKEKEFILLNPRLDLYGVCKKCQK